MIVPSRIMVENEREKAILSPGRRVPADPIGRVDLERIKGDWAPRVF
jgi:hypothetical protein